MFNCLLKEINTTALLLSNEANTSVEDIDPKTYRWMEAYATNKQGQEVVVFRFKIPNEEAT